MITTCTDCEVRYRLEDGKIPPRVIRVRCPACRGVFSLDGRSAQKPMTAVDKSTPRPQAVSPPVAAVETPSLVKEQPAASRTSVAVMEAVSPAAVGGKRRRRAKEEMLARALVSDIKVYNKDLYESARAEGNLLEVLGPEIKKSWELYKEKVTPEVANSTEHFRLALNEILADGEKVF